MGIFQIMSPDVEPVEPVDYKALSEQHYVLLNSTQKELAVLNLAITLMKKQLDKHNLPYFEGDATLEKNPYNMSTEELKAANEIVTSRIKTQVKPKENRVPMPTYEEEAKKHEAELKCAPTEAILNLAKWIIEQEIESLQNNEAHTP